MSKTNALYRHVSSVVARLQAQYLAGDPHARKQLAELRRCVGRPLGDSPTTWMALGESWPEDLEGRGDSPSPAENAAYTAIVLAALHLQSASSPVHIPNVGMGTAVRRLAASKGTDVMDSTLGTRVSSVLRAPSHDVAAYHLRAIVPQLRAAGVGLDYGRLATDLYRRHWPDGSRSVVTAWMREIYSSRSQKPTSDSTNHTPNK